MTLNTTHRLAIGCMTGTSIDALDVALVQIEGQGLSMRARFQHGVALPLGALAPRLRAFAEQQAMRAGDIAALARDFSLLHAHAIDALLKEAGVTSQQVALACVHGQTVYHVPPVSWQLFEPAILAQRLGVPIVCNLRQADLAAGGQGAPITPIADGVLFGDLALPRGEGEERASGGVAIVNLGGFANYTLLRRAGPPLDIASIDGGDVCACNQVLDALARTLLHKPYDADGQAAWSGVVHDDALEDLEGVLRAQSRSGRSMGTGDEVGGWISRFRAVASPKDLARTACEAIAGVIAERVRAGRVLLAGGGVRNRALARAIAGASAGVVTTTKEHGVPIEYREAACFAVLGALCQDRLPITVPSVTGVGRAPLAGQWAFV